MKYEYEWGFWSTLELETMNRWGHQGFKLVAIVQEGADFSPALIFMKEVPEQQGEQTMELPPFLANRKVSND